MSPAASDDEIVVIPTGGTFEAKPCEDARHPPEYVETFKGADSPVPPTIERLKEGKNITLYRWDAGQEERFNKDSKEYSTADIHALADILRNDKRRVFVLTHGTDDATVNAELLKKQPGLEDKTIAFVATMVPLSMHGKKGVKSDGIDALKFTFDTIAGKSPGVYVVGRNKSQRLEFFDPGTVRKDWDESPKNLAFTLTERRR